MSTYAFLRAPWDAHTLGVTEVQRLTRDAGGRVVAQDADVEGALRQLGTETGRRRLARWVDAHRVSHLGVSCRLDPHEAVEFLEAVRESLKEADMTEHVRLYFAGLPAACDQVHRRHGLSIVTFRGSETPGESAVRLGLVPGGPSIDATDDYDRAKLDLSRQVLGAELPERVTPHARGDYAHYGTVRDTLIQRLDTGRRSWRPLMRAHLGPYLPDRDVALSLFDDWLRRLAVGGLLDIVSVGQSQLSQEAFGREWGSAPNGGGLPVNTPVEYERIWEAARPMLVRAYAGTVDVRRLARIHQDTLNMAWHALSVWWFCEIDGRGPAPLTRSIREHLDTVGDIARWGVPAEANVAHQFAFRGADDVTYVLSAYLAARAMKARGLRTFVLQVMLNTPATTGGTADLAKARATVGLVRSLEDEGFRVLVQPRAGLNHFSTDAETARVQLAAASMAMVDIEPLRRAPDIIHVVSHCEGNNLAGPDELDDSLRVTIAALEAYRAHVDARGSFADEAAVNERCDYLTAEVHDVLREIQVHDPEMTEPEALARIFEAGFLPVPDLVYARDRYPHATAWRTRAGIGGVDVIDGQGQPIPARERARVAGQNLTNDVARATLPQ